MTTAIFQGSNRPLLPIQLASIQGRLSATGGIWQANNYDYAILFTGSSGTLVLPAASSMPNQTLKIFNNTTGNITITGPSQLNGTGAMPQTLVAKFTPTQITSDGIANWWTI